MAQSAMSVLQSYEQQLGTKDLVAVVSKIRSLVEALPTLSQGGKVVDLKLHLQLLKGYVQVLGPHAAKELSVSTFPYQPLIRKWTGIFVAETPYNRSFGAHIIFVGYYRADGGGFFSDGPAIPPSTGTRSEW